MGVPMRRLLPFVAPLLLATPLLAATPAGRPIGLAVHSGTKADQAARQLVAQDLAEARRAGDEPLVLTATAPLGGPHEASILFIQLQSPRECGSAGCSTSAFQPDGRGWRKVLDAVSGPIAVQAESHKGMRDLLVGRTRYIWTGAAYADTVPAPDVSLRRRRH